MGYRYRLHVRGLPGKPDIVFHGRRRVILCMGASGTNTRIALTLAFRFPYCLLASKNWNGTCNAMKSTSNLLEN